MLFGERETGNYRSFRTGCMHYALAALPTTDMRALTMNDSVKRSVSCCIRTYFFDGWLAGLVRRLVWHILHNKYFRSLDNVSFLDLTILVTSQDLTYPERANFENLTNLLTFL